MTRRRAAAPSRRRRPAACYRHPDRETYIRCTRCERPICPDCMIAGVGRLPVPGVRPRGQQGRPPGHAPSSAAGSPTTPAGSARSLIGINVGRLRAAAGRSTAFTDAVLRHRARLRPDAQRAGRRRRRASTTGCSPRRSCTPGSVHLLLNMYALLPVRPAARGGARPGPLHRAVPACPRSAAARCRTPSPTRPALARRVRARSSACSGPTSWSAAGWAADATSVCRAARDQLRLRLPRRRASTGGPTSAA